MTKEEQIREKVRKMLNQILDEEYEGFIKEIAENKLRQINPIAPEIIKGVKKRFCLSEGK